MTRETGCEEEKGTEPRRQRRGEPTDREKMVDNPVSVEYIDLKMRGESASRQAPWIRRDGSSGNDAEIPEPDSGVREEGERHRRVVRDSGFRILSARECRKERKI